MCKGCCFFVPLKIGCIIIGSIFLSYHVGEVLTHINDTVFIREVAQKPWAAVIMAPVFMGSIIASMLLIYGACEERRGFVLVWLIVHVPICYVYVILAIYDKVKYSPPLIIVCAQILIIVGLFYSLCVVYSYYKYLIVETYEDEEYEF